MSVQPCIACHAYPDPCHVSTGLGTVLKFVWLRGRSSVTHRVLAGELIYTVVSLRCPQTCRATRGCHWPWPCAPWIPPWYMDGGMDGGLAAWHARSTRARDFVFLLAAPGPGPGTSLKPSPHNPSNSRSNGKPAGEVYLLLKSACRACRSSVPHPSQDK